MVEQDLFQSQDGGSIPTSPLQLYIDKISPKAGKLFISTHHYSKSCPNGSVFYGVYFRNKLYGAACFGRPAMRHQSKCYKCDIELRRFVLLNEAPKNSESRTLSVMIRKIKKLGYVRLLSLADPEFGHTGVIYRASGFKYCGVERGGGSRLLVVDNKIVHSRTAFALYGVSGINNLKEKLGNERVSGRNKLRKHIFIMDLFRKTQCHPKATSKVKYRLQPKS